MSGVNYLLGNPNKILGEPASKYYKSFYSGNFFFFNPNFFSQIDFSKIEPSLSITKQSLFT